MTLLTRSQGSIVRFTPADREDLEHFQRQTFGDGAVQLEPDYFRWLFEEPPRRDPNGIQFWICRRQSGIVGQQGGVPFHLKVGERLVDGSWGVDLMVAPAWRLRGVGPVLSDTHIQANAITVSLGMSDPAYKAYKRAGWIDLDTVPTYVRAIDPVRCLAVSGRDSRVLGAAVAAARPVVAGADLALHGLNRLSGTRLEEVPAFDARVDALWLAVSPAYAVMARRDLAALRWRFDLAPRSDRFYRFYLSRGGVPLGYVVLRIEHWHGQPLGVIIDYLARPGWMLSAFAHVLHWARRQKLVAVMCRTLNPAGGRMLNALGFLTLHNGWRRPTRMMIRVAPQAADLAALAGNPASWFVTAADSDIGFRELGDEPAPGQSAS